METVYKQLKDHQKMDWENQHRLIPRIVNGESYYEVYYGRLCDAFLAIMIGAEVMKAIKT